MLKIEQSPALGMKSCPSGGKAGGHEQPGERSLSHLRLLCALQRALSLFGVVLSDEGLGRQGRGEVSDTSLLSARVPPHFPAVQVWTQRIMVT